MESKIRVALMAGVLMAISQWAAGPSYGVEDPNAGIDLAASGVQARVGKVIKIRVTAGETRFQIDTCPQDPAAPAFFAIASTNPDKVEITRLLLAAMIFNRDVKLYNAAYGDDVDDCPRTGRSDGNVTVGTVRVSD